MDLAKLKKPSKMILENVMAIPNCILLPDYILALGKRNDDDFFMGKYLKGNSEKKLFWSGRQPNVFDIKVWSSLLVLANDDFFVDTTKYVLLKFMDMDRSGRNYDSINKSLHVLDNAFVHKGMVEQNRFNIEFTTNLLFTYKQEECSKPDRKKRKDEERIKIDFSYFLEEFVDEDDPMWGMSYINKDLFGKYGVGLEKIILLWFVAAKLRKKSTFMKDVFYEHFSRGSNLDKKSFFLLLRRRIVPSLVSNRMIKSFSEDTKTITFVKG